MNMDIYYYFLVYVLLPFPVYLINAPNGVSKERYPYTSNLLLYNIKQIFPSYTDTIISFTETAMGTNTPRQYFAKTQIQNGTTITSYVIRTIVKTLNPVTNINTYTFYLYTFSATQSIYYASYNSAGNEVNINYTPVCGNHEQIPSDNPNNIPINDPYYSNYYTNVTLTQSLLNPTSNTSLDLVYNANQTLSRMLYTFATSQSTILSSAQLTFTFMSLIEDDPLRDDCTQDYVENVIFSTNIILQDTENGTIPIVPNSYDTFFNIIYPINSNSFNASYIVSANYNGILLLDFVETNNSIPDERWPRTKKDILIFKEKYVYGPFSVDFYKKHRLCSFKYFYSFECNTPFPTLINLNDLRTPDKQIRKAVCYTSRYYSNVKLACYD